MAWDDAVEWRVCIALWDSRGLKRPNNRITLDAMLEVLLLPGGELMFGRLATSDIVLQYPSVARRHGRFMFGDDGVLRVLDHGSTNGVILERAGSHEMKRLESRPTVVELGDAVRVGQVLLQCSVHPLIELVSEGPELSLDEQIVWMRGVSHARNTRELDIVRLSREAPRRVDEEALYYLAQTQPNKGQTRWFGSAFELQQQVLCKDISRGWFAAGVPISPTMAEDPLIAITQTSGAPILYKLQVYEDALAIVTHAYPTELVQRLRDEASSSLEVSRQEPEHLGAWRQAFRARLDALVEGLYGWT